MVKIVMPSAALTSSQVREGRTQREGRLRGRLPLAQMAQSGDFSPARQKPKNGQEDGLESKQAGALSHIEAARQLVSQAEWPTIPLSRDSWIVYELILLSPVL